MKSATPDDWLSLVELLLRTVDFLFRDEKTKIGVPALWPSGKPDRVRFNVADSAKTIIVDVWLADLKRCELAGVAMRWCIAELRGAVKQAGIAVMEISQLPPGRRREKFEVVNHLQEHRA